MRSNHHEKPLMMESVIVTESHPGQMAHRQMHPRVGCHKQKVRHQRVWLMTLSVLGIFLMAVSMLYVQYQDMVNALAGDTFYDGVFVEGINLGGKTHDQATEVLTPLLDDIRQEIDLTVRFEEQEYHYTEADFGFTHDLETVLEEAFAVARTGSLLTRYQLQRDLQEMPESFAITPTLTGEKTVLDEIAKVIAEKNDQQAKNASIKTFTPKPGQSVAAMLTFEQPQQGRAIDQKRLVEDATEILSAETKIGVVTATATEIPYELSVEQLKQQITPFQTFRTISKNNAAGNNNMGLALKKINGTVVQPGEEFSFDAVVGKRTAERGFQNAGVIVNGEFDQGMGGGVCQASTTLYGAVLRAGDSIEVVQRNNHSRPSTYVPLGQDAMISWGYSDFRFKNVTDYPIMIMSYMNGTTLTAQLFGYHSGDWDTIEVSTWKTATLQPKDATYIKDPSLPKGEQVVEQQAVIGANVSGQRIFKKNGVKVKTEPIKSSYYPAMPAKIRVGTGADVKAVPPEGGDSEGA